MKGLVILHSIRRGIHEFSYSSFFEKNTVFKILYCSFYFTENSVKLIKVDNIEVLTIFLVC